MSVPASEIAKYLGLRLRGPDVSVTHVAPLSAPGPGALLFARKLDEATFRRLAEVRGILVLTPPAEAPAYPFTYIECDNPRLCYARVVQCWFARRPPPGIHGTAIVGAGARISSGASVGPYCNIGDNVEVGAGAILHGHVQVYEGVRLGEGVIVDSGAVIGAEGFGYERDEAGRAVRLPHLGRVIIEDDVEIGAGSCIDRGTIGDTIVRVGTKIDNLVHIAHNNDIGEHCIIAAQAMTAGSVRVGARSWIAPGVCIREKVTIGADAFVGIGSTVVRDVADGMSVMGSPAREIRQYKRLLSRLDGMLREND